MLNSKPKNDSEISHLHIFCEKQIEFRVLTPSPQWCWKSFLQDGITEYPIIGFASVIKSQADRPPTVKVFSKKNILPSE